MNKSADTYQLLISNSISDCISQISKTLAVFHNLKMHNIKDIERENLPEKIRIFNTLQNEILSLNKEEREPSLFNVVLRSTNSTYQFVVDIKSDIKEFSGEEFDNITVTPAYKNICCIETRDILTDIKPILDKLILKDKSYIEEQFNIFYEGIENNKFYHKSHILDSQNNTLNSNTDLNFRFLFKKPEAKESK